MKTPGFQITNNTLWPIQISLNNVGPLYWEVLQPGETFTRDTGCWWFTVRAEILLDDSQRITTEDAILPVAFLVAQVAVAVATAGTATVLQAAGTAAAAGSIGYSLYQDISNPTGHQDTAHYVLQALNIAASAAGAAKLLNNVEKFTIMGADFIFDKLISDQNKTIEMARLKSAMQRVFTEQACLASKAGVFSGGAWPFQGDVEPISINGGPYFEVTGGFGKDDATQVQLLTRPLSVSSTPQKSSLFGSVSCRIVSESSGMVIDLPGSISSPDTHSRVTLWRDNGGANQHWKLHVPVDQAGTKGDIGHVTSCKTSGRLGWVSGRDIRLQEWSDALRKFTSGVVPGSQDWNRKLDDFYIAVVSGQIELHFQKLKDEPLFLGQSQETAFIYISVRFSEAKEDCLSLLVPNPDLTTKVQHELLAFTVRPDSLIELKPYDDSAAQHFKIEKV